MRSHDRHEALAVLGLEQIGHLVGDLDTLCATKIGYQAVLAGHTALFITADQLLGELAALDSDSALRRKQDFPAGCKARLTSGCARR